MELVFPKSTGSLWPWLAKDLSIAFLHRATTFLEGAAYGVGTRQSHDALVVETHPAKMIKKMCDLEKCGSLEKDGKLGFS